jgi:hypothetical protein
LSAPSVTRRWSSISTAIAFPYLRDTDVTAKGAGEA